MYQLRLTAVIGEMLYNACRRKPDNRSDPFAVAVIIGSEIVGHICLAFRSGIDIIISLCPAGLTEVVPCKSSLV